MADAAEGGYSEVDLISDALPFGRLWYGEPNAVICGRILE